VLSNPTTAYVDRLERHPKIATMIRDLDQRIGTPAVIHRNALGRCTRRSDGVTKPPISACHTPDDLYSPPRVSGRLKPPAAALTHSARAGISGWVQGRSRTGIMRSWLLRQNRPGR